MFTKAWLLNLVQHTVLTALAAFTSVVVQAGANWDSIATIRAGAIAAGAAVFIVLQGILAAPISPTGSPTASLPRAVGERIAERRGPSDAPPSSADIRELVGVLRDLVATMGPSVVNNVTTAPSVPPPSAPPSPPTT